MLIRISLIAALWAGAFSGALYAADDPAAPKKEDAPKAGAPRGEAPSERAPLPPPRREEGQPRFGEPRGPGEPGPGGVGPREGGFGAGPRRPEGEGQPQPRDGGFGGPRRPEGDDPNGPLRNDGRGLGQYGPGGFGGGGPRRPGGPGGPFNPQDIERMKESDPEMYAFAKDDMDLERQSFELSDKIRRTTRAEEKELLKDQLQGVVENHFRVRQERREMELKRLEEQLNRMRESVKKRADAKDDIIKQRIAELTGEKENPF